MNFAAEDEEDVFSRWEIMLERSTSHMVVQQYSKAIEILSTAENQVLEVLKNYEDETLKSVLPLLLNNIRSMIAKANEGESASQQYITTLSVIDEGEKKSADSKVDGGQRHDDLSYSLSPASSGKSLNIPPQETEKELMSAEQIQELMRMETVVSGSIRKTHLKDIQKIRNILDQADDSIDTPGKSRAGTTHPNPNIISSSSTSIEDSVAT
eukprot:gene26852-35545_t